MKKKWLLFLLLAVLSAGIMGNTVYAWLIDRKEVKNTVGFVTNDIHIHEDFDPPGNVEPGQRIVKKPCLVNDSAIPVYVRAQVNFTSSKGRDQCDPLVIHDSWKLEADGYYYYTGILEAGKRTPCIFDNVVIKKSVKKEDLVPFDILVYGESVQAKGYASAHQAFQALQEVS